MKRGPKAEMPSVKLTRGTFRPSRDAVRVELIEPGALPIQPEWLTEAGREIWHDDVGRVSTHRLVSESDSSLFATYCNLLGACTAAWKLGGVPPAAHLMEVRKLAEIFGIAGGKSRVKAGGDGPKASNPFARNGRR